jgi:predicted GNAT family acetyltransferase
MSVVRDNPAESRYEIEIDGQTAIAVYRRDGDTFAFTHTVVPEALEGRGIASHLIKDALTDVRAKGGKIVPLCSFVAAYVERHPEERDLVAQAG